jgi:hypothetical protein
VSVVTNPAYNSTSVQARNFADKLFQTKTKSYQEQYPHIAQAMLNEMRAYRMGLEIRNDAKRAAGSDAVLQDRLERLAWEIEMTAEYGVQF